MEEEEEFCQAIDSFIHSYIQYGSLFIEFRCRQSPVRTPPLTSSSPPPVVALCFFLCGVLSNSAHAKSCCHTREFAQRARNVCSLSRRPKGGIGCAHPSGTPCVSPNPVVARAKRKRAHVFES